MHGAELIRDLAIIMFTAGVVTVVFHRLRQPVVLGYIVAGVIVGPHTPPFSLVHDEKTIETLAELGVVFLLFSLGLEFSLRKLARVGVTAVVAALAEILLMAWLGWTLGTAFGWGPMDALFLGAILAISSTTIIVKALDELGMKQERFAQLVFGILIVEDILAIGMIALLSGLAVTGALSAAQTATTIGALVLFLVVSFVVGILLVPRLLAYVAAFESREMLLVTVLGLCFGFCLLVLSMGYSVALGAFVIGAIMAESRQRHTIEALIEPVRDMFSAIFFVAIGILLDPRALVTYAGPIAILTLAVVAGKVLSCGLGAFVSGQDGRTSLRVGMGLAQIGEFSFIIASMGLALGVTSHFLYPIAVAVSAVTTLLTPYLIRAADPLADALARVMPPPVARVFETYTAWLGSLQPSGDRAALARIVRRIVIHVAVNCALVLALFVASGHVGPRVEMLEAWVPDARVRNAGLWGATFLVSLPFLVAAYRKLKALSLLLAEVQVTPARAGQYTEPARRVVAEVIPVIGLALLFVLITAASGSILPPAELLMLTLALGALLTGLLWHRMVRLHARLQIALLDARADGESD
ncbi:MAG: cation:proton antiporter [bacterium]|nr:cation:proton antiporter [bacterium]